jgi:Mor family transcriptional regulator
MTKEAPIAIRRYVKYPDIYKDWLKGIKANELAIRYGLSRSYLYTMLRNFQADQKK